MILRLIQRLLPALCILLPLGCGIAPDVIDLSNENEYSRYINIFAPSEDAFVALQRMIKPYIERQDWNRAVQILQNYRSKFPGMGTRIDKIIAILNEPPSNLVITNLGFGINTQYDEIKPNPVPDGSRMYFASKDRPDGFGGLDIYVAKREGDTWTSAQNLGPAINTSQHESINSISADGTRIVLYGAFEGHMGRGDNFYFEKTPQGWSGIRNFPPPVNSTDWDSDGYFTADGKAFLFASDRPGCIGERHPRGDFDLKTNPFHGSYGGNSDIFVCLKTPAGWSDPINLGPVINTPYCERSPFLHPDGKTLYFSSDGHYGLGRLDVFKSVRLKEDSWTEWSEPVNLGKEINTAEDDWGYKISADGEIAYFSASGKMGGFGLNDIYSITLPKAAKPEEKVIAITGKVLDEDGNPVTGMGDLDWNDLKNKGWRVKEGNGADVNPPGYLSAADAARHKYKVIDQNGNAVKWDGALDWNDLLKKGWKVFDENGMPVHDPRLLSMSDLKARNWNLTDGKGNPIDLFGAFTAADAARNRWKVTDKDGKPVLWDGLLDWNDLLKKGWKVTDENGNPLDGKSLAGKWDGSLGWDELARRGWIVRDANGNRIDGNMLSWADIAKNKWLVYDQNGNPVTGSGLIKWEDLLGGKKDIGEATIDPQTGEYTLYVPLGKKYSLYPDIPGYYPDSKTVDLTNRKDARNIRIDFDLKSLYGMKTKRDKNGQLLAARVNNIFFDFDKYDLKPESDLELDRLVSFLGGNTGFAIEIAAHTDSLGSDDYNLKLSQKRAQSVVNYLIEHNVPKSRLVARGYGRSRPVADNATEDGRAQNRRVEFRIAE